MVKDENSSGKHPYAQNTSTYGYLRYGDLPRYADLPTLVMWVAWSLKAFVTWAHGHMGGLLYKGVRMKVKPSRLQT
jgi:hypothetical protein